MKNIQLIGYKVIFIILLIVITANQKSNCQYQQQYPGTNIRGKVVINDPYNNFPPLKLVKVDLYQFDAIKNVWVLIAATYSDEYGFYYYNYIKPGDYSIQVNQQKNYSVTILQIDYNQTNYQDLPVLYY
jgi:hypothetical protein